MRHDQPWETMGVLNFIHQSRSCSTPNFYELGCSARSHCPTQPAPIPASPGAMVEPWAKPRGQTFLADRVLPARLTTKLIPTSLILRMPILRASLPESIHSTAFLSQLSEDRLNSKLKCSKCKLVTECSGNPFLCRHQGWPYEQFQYLYRGHHWRC